MQRYARPLEWVVDALVEDFLDPEELWFFGCIDRRERTYFTTATRNYLAIDEPGRTIEPALDALLTRLEAGDANLIVVPRMPNVERERHMDEFSASLGDPAAKAIFDERQRSMREHWDRHWHPGTFRALASNLPEPLERAWIARLHASARPAVEHFCAEHGIELGPMTHLVFE